MISPPPPVWIPACAGMTLGVRMAAGSGMSDGVWASPASIASLARVPLRFAKGTVGNGLIPV